MGVLAEQVLHRLAQAGLGRETALCGMRLGEQGLGQRQRVLFTHGLPVGALGQFAFVAEELVDVTQVVGIEPIAAFLQACLAVALCASPESGDTQLRTHDLAALREIVIAWPTLPPELRTACLAVTRAARPA